MIETIPTSRGPRMVVLSCDYCDTVFTQIARLCLTEIDGPERSARVLMAQADKAGWHQELIFNRPKHTCPECQDKMLAAMHGTNVNGVMP